ncbi:hypothetical protein MYCTH_2295301 [Thermothelomyces thermophilus ATCC 42464]|uniref:Uncharacterized protein n=1 Tax=Thermothelomyces thermophilus (strain ATCC 42464 / BCRC 31852 / DSM 1799) TaxID=573729 RepID=G2Q4G7_THET4|nr:uncharacterized protein MYCTH_2295301 [Thermothelomyces thermophilus ATCC 42464]AEO53660.1 hypothetical protein MYCTH_2295301 [Thermothelomyces thermophilus ATCC 42464]
MASIHELARDGTLTKAQAREARKSINQPDASGIPPLTPASRHGHLEAVKILLDEGANPNLKDRNGATALNIAAHYAPKNQAAIIRALLKARASVDATDPKLGNNTPLMTVIVQTRNLDSISELINKGASLSAKNNAGETAEDLAKSDAVVLAALRSKTGGRNLLSRVARKFTKTVLTALSLLNEPLKSGVRFLTWMYNYTPQIRSRPRTSTPPALTSGETPREAPQEAPEETPEETPEAKREREINKQLDQLSNEIKESNLSKFTGMDDRFFDTLVEKTKALRKDINTDLGRPENLSDMINLALYKPVLYCDDSGSMRGAGYECQRKMVKRICSVTTKLVPEGVGVDLHLINHSQDYVDLREEEIDKKLGAISPNGGTKLGTNLEKKILHPFVYKPLESGGLKRPLLISIITDGDPTEEHRDTLKNAILNCKERLDKYNYPSYAVVFQISQIGDSEAAKSFLLGLRNDDELSDTLMVTTDRLDDIFETQRNNERALEVWLLKTLVEPIYRWGPDFVKKQRRERREE